MNPGEAAELLGVAPNTLKRRAATWGIRIRTLPGVNRRKVNRSDVSRVLLELTEAEAATVAPFDGLPPVRMRSRHHKGGSDPVEQRAAAMAGAPAVKRKKGTARTSAR